MVTKRMFLDNFAQPFALTNHGIRLPEFHFPEEDYEKYGISKGSSNLEILTALCRVGFKEKLDRGLIPKDRVKEYGERVKMELGVFDKTTFTDYILLVNSVISYARKNNIPIGFGRGCLSGNSTIRTESGYSCIRDMKVGDSVVNRFGQNDKVTQVHKYLTDESLVSFETYKKGGEPAAFTPDHKILTLNSKKVIGDTFQKRVDVNHLDMSDCAWTQAKDVQVGDYVVRYTGRVNPIVDIELIDLSQYCLDHKGFPDTFTDSEVIYQHSNNQNNKLSGRYISRKYKIGLLQVQKYKKGISKYLEAITQIEAALELEGISKQDFTEHSGVEEKRLKRYFPISEDFCYFLGFYIGDGCRVRGNAVLALHSEVDKGRLVTIEKFLQSENLPYSLYHSKSTKCTQLWVQNRIFAEFLNSLIFGKCHEKVIPFEFMNLPDSKLKALLSGLLDSDGHRTKSGSCSIKTTSPILAQQIHWIVDYFKNPGNLGEYQDKKNTWRKCYSVAFNDQFTEGNRSNNSFFYIGDYLALKVRKINQTLPDDGYVYDLSVESDPSYHTSSFVVHNSGGGSLVNYLLDFVYSDPIEKGLFFERFVSTSRARTTWINGIPYLDGSLICDLDLDFSEEGRVEVIEWLRELYKDKFCKVATFSTLTTRILIKELCKIVLGMSEEDAGHISSFVPEVFGKVFDPQKSRENSEEFKAFCDANPVIWTCLEQLHECVKNRGVHPSAYSISYDKLEDWCPLQETPDGVVSTYDMNDISNSSVKLDLLGLSTLDLVYNTAKLAGIDINSIDVESYDDIYKYLQDLQTPYGLFQISGIGVVRALRKIKPKNLNQLSDVLAIVRPGSLAFVDQYADYTNNGTVQSVHPYFDDILAESGGLCLMQETQLAMVKKIGLDLDSAEQVRRCLGKKDTKKMEDWKTKIYEVGVNNKVPIEALNALWKILIDSSNYSFNKSHSMNYGVLSAISVYLKFKYPTFFYCEALKTAFNKPDSYESVNIVHSELPLFGINLLPPDLVKSDMDFSIEGNNIRFGLSAIKGVSDKSLEKLQTFLDKDKANKFQVFFAAKESGLNIAVLAALIQSGCLQSMGSNRPKMTLEAQVWGKLNERERNYCLINGEKYGYDLINALRDYTNWNDGKPFKETRLATIRKQTAPYMEIFSKNSKFPKFANFIYEKSLLGYSWSGTLREIFVNECPNLKSCDEVKNQVDKDNPVDIVAIVVETKKGKSKAGNDYLRMTVSDETGTITAIMTKDKLARFLDNNTVPAEGEIVHLEGTKNDDGMWLNRCSTYKERIYFRASDLKKYEESV